MRSCVAFCHQYQQTCFDELGGYHANQQPTKKFCTTSKTEGEVGAVKLVEATPSNSLLTVPRR